jgi:hypothetical protein
VVAAKMSNPVGFRGGTVLVNAGSLSNAPFLRLRAS